MDEILDVSQRRSSVEREGQLTSWVGTGSASKVIKRPEPLKDTKKQTILKDMFAEGVEPKTTTTEEAPTVEEKAPENTNKSSEEVVVGPKEVQYWKDLEKELTIATVLQSFKRHKNQAALERMSRPILLKYVEGRLGTSKKRQVGPQNRMVKACA